jgi:hypothetical protein
LAVAVSCLSNTTLSFINFNVFIRFPANNDDDYNDDDDDDDYGDNSVINKTKTLRIRYLVEVSADICIL